MSKFDLNSFIGTPDVLKNAVQNIPIEKLVPYKNHCFKLYEGERLDDMVRSVQQYGIMIPVIVRTIPGSDNYEILSGHNRVNAAKIAGKKNVPAVVMENLPDEYAMVYVTETNIFQRGFRELRISEQAFAVAIRYKRLFDQKKLQAISEELQMLEKGKNGAPVGHGKSQKEVGAPVGHEDKSRVRDIAAEEYGIGHSTVARLLRINELSAELKEMVDEGRIKIRPAVELSYLSRELQAAVYAIIDKHNIETVDMKMAKQLRDIAESYSGRPWG